ncbi:sensor histidine kinase [Streptosporangium roseum]|uniref:sensor histidine kinase n=1 Tax=Streptosporangium roseum TaxID=2001 RepID=UPI0006903558|nr:sensor histidine kinase [Streptosporangium roseum]
MNLLARRPPPWLLILADTVVAVLLALASTANPPELTTNTVTMALCWLLALPVAVRRVWPEPAYYGALLIGLAVLALQTNWLMPTAVVALAIYPVATGRPVWRSVVALVSGLLVNGGSLLVSMPGPAQYSNGWPDPVFILGTTCLIIAASWSLGTTARTRREFATREARRQTEQAAADERLRIARELHDVVAHSMSMITVKAGVAAKVLDKHPEEGRKALRAIEEIGRGSLAEMRQFLGVLRDPGSAPDSTPLPRLADLPSLAHRAAEAGVRVDLSINGTVPDSMTLAVYRIVQEAITNVVKHAAPAHCQASVSVADGRLRISVVDDGPGQRVLPGRPGGHGLAGMRERVLLYGGTFEAGPLPRRGFGVHTSWEIP